MVKMYYVYANHHHHHHVLISNTSVKILVDISEQSAWHIHV